MPRQKFPFLIRQRTRHGTLVCYVRKRTGLCVRLRAEFGSPEFVAQYFAALSGEAPLVAAKSSKGSLSWLIDRYQQSSAWVSLSPATQRQRELIFKQVIAAAGKEQFTDITSKVIRSGRESRKDTPFTANNFLKAMRKLFEWAKEAEYVLHNPAADVAFLSQKTEGHTPWSIEDVHHYEAHWPKGTRERVWLHVLLYTGMRLGDACKVGWQHVKDGWVTMRAEKTDKTSGVILEVAVSPVLMETLKAGPTGDLAWISNAYGRPFVKEAFGNAFRRACLDAKIKDRSAHGLRKTLAAHAAQGGASEEEMKSLFGWMTNRMSQVYTRSANRRKMSSQAVSKMTMLSNKKKV